MPAKRFSEVNQSRELFAPRIYYFHPLLAGDRASWPHHLRRCQEMQFDHVLTGPLFAPGADGNIFLTGDHERVHCAIDGSHDADAFVAGFAETCRQHGLRLLADIVVGRVAPHADVAQSAPGWFHVDEPTSQRVDPRSSLRQPNAAYARFDDPVIAKEVAGWWAERLIRLADRDVAGFRCLDPQLVPANVWRHVIAAVQQKFPHCRFLAWTPGLAWRNVAQLKELGFAGAFSSLPWWDGRASWFVEEHELLRTIGSVIACPEAPFGTRLARRFEDAPDQAQVYRHWLRCAVATGDGLMVPMGFEFAVSEDMDDRQTANAGFAPIGAARNLDVTAEIGEANALSEQLSGLGIAGEMRTLTDPAAPVTVLLRSDAPDVRQARSPIVVMINPDWQREHPLPVSLDPLPAAAGASLAAEETIAADHESNVLVGGEVRILRARPTEPIKSRRADLRPAKLAAAPRIVIDSVVPSVEGGRFAAKCVIGEPVTIAADVFIDGHELLVVEVLWRAADQKEWRREPMRLLGNDRWQATILPDRIGRYEFTIEAWVDRYGTLCRDVEIKRPAGGDVAVEIAEARHLLEQAKERTQDDAGNVISAALTWLRDASVDASAQILLTPDLREVMREAEEQLFRCGCEPAFALDVERPQAAFASWYELFPRSATTTSTRHGTLADVVRRLPALRDMGFDVLYLPPIHPIGNTNRKGKNNSLRAEADDVGSPYAIGSSEGGHTAIHPALGTLDDFRQLRAAAADHGMELALDFAVQCSPDHPWLKEHPEWFSWRPDGSVRYAENPPKKYEDIVNVDFYGGQSIPDLWIALRDIVLFWLNEGVRIFRVDNPHTKPLPFWEWLIAQVRSRNPEVIFLSEAFTRPKMMYRLAKIGFSQSYTYFTWRNSKQEITDYFVELTTSEVKDYFRPHLFVNTPDINPYFLQTSGRPGFLIRAALAATLSGLWGMYSGFELCEAAALPGREEYLDSEKYEIRVRSRDAPGNIIPEIRKLNRIRKSNPALQTHLGLRFYPAHGNQVILYGKPLPAGDDMILIAVSLDPFHVQEVTIEVPLWEWKLSDSAAVAVTDLMREQKFTWHGKLQRIRLDPAELPFAIWRIAPRPGG
jgi:starch synthase (maltosyl-transferring)